MVSVILPVHNRAALLPRAMDSVLRQTVADLELIVVDDASTDGSAEIAEECGDPRVRVLRLEEQRGACAARNRGIDAARGEYIAFQDSDDVWHGDKLEKQLRFLDASDADIVFCGFQRCHEDGEAWARFPHEEVAEGPVTRHQLLFENLASTQCILGRRIAVWMTLFDEKYPRMQDWAFILRAAGRYRIAYQKAFLADVYVQPDSLSGNAKNAIAAQELLLDVYEDEIRGDPVLARRWMNSFRHFSREGGLRVWKPYLRLLNPRHPPVLNAKLLAAALLGAVRGRTA